MRSGGLYGEVRSQKVHARGKGVRGAMPWGTRLEVGLEDLRLQVLGRVCEHLSFSCLRHGTICAYVI